VRNARVIDYGDGHRIGLLGTAFGYAVADVISPKQVSKFVPLSELDEQEA
jgi:hypothetical protein